MTGFPYSKRRIDELEHVRFVLNSMPSPALKMFDELVRIIKSDFEAGEVSPDIEYAYHLFRIAAIVATMSEVPDEHVRDMLEAHSLIHRGLDLFRKISEDVIVKTKMTKANHKDMFRILRHLAIAKRALQNLRARNKYGIDPDSGEYDIEKDPSCLLDATMDGSWKTAKIFAEKLFNIVVTDEDEEKAANEAEKDEAKNE